jgi:protein SCO1/2
LIAPGRNRAVQISLCRELRERQIGGTGPIFLRKIHKGKYDMKVKKVGCALSLLFFFCLVAIPLNGYAENTAESAGGSRKAGAAIKGDSLFRATEKGFFSVSMETDDRELTVGVNSFNLSVRDSAGRELSGAELAVTPWMPEHGHGVWEKPAVTDRGGGNYRVDNVVLIMAGRWDLKINIKRGADEDLTVFSFSVGVDDGKPEDAAKAAEEYVRTVEYYKVPNVTLLNQDGKKIPLRTFIDSGKPVIVDFIYTTCTTICPILSAGFSSLRDELGDGAGGLQLISISIDPEHDRPEQMKEYLTRYNSGEGWDFLTGSREDIALVMKAFDAAVRDKMSHLPLYILRGPRSDEWVRIKGLIGSSDLLREFRRIENK